MNTESEEVIIPRNLDEAAKAVASFGEAQREHDRLEIELKEKKAQLDKEYDDRMGQQRRKLEGLRKALLLFAKIRRSKLIAEGKNSFVFPDGGILGWRSPKPSREMANPACEDPFIKPANLGRIVRL